MVVAVQKGLENIKQRLREKGYEVVTLGEYNYPIDAVIYKDYNPTMSFVTNNNIPNLTSGTIGLGDQGRNFGVFMVNASNKSVDEIDVILRRKTYTPLF